MAVIDSKGRLHGKLGNVVYRTVGNTNIVQSKPGKVRQTGATKQSALEFGLASNAAKVIRTAFFPLTYAADGGMINRLNVAALKSIKNSEDKARGERDLHDADLRHLEGFQFNKNSPLDQVLQVRPISQLDSENRVKVQIPAFKTISDLQHPIHSRSCTLRLMVVAINFREDYYEYISYKDIELGNRKLFAGEEWHPEEVMPTGSIVFVSASLHYYGVAGMTEQAPGLNNINFNPAELLAAFKVPFEEETGNNPDEAAGNTNDELKRYPLTNYRGAELLKEQRKLKQQLEKKLGKSTTIQNRAVKDTGFVLPKGRITVQKE